MFIRGGGGRCCWRRGRGEGRGGGRGDGKHQISQAVSTRERPAVEVTACKRRARALIADTQDVRGAMVRKEF